jgi:predicted RNase H-like HicB family nuclease
VCAASSMITYVKYLTYVWLRSKLVRGEGGVMAAVHYDSYTDARTHLKDLLDAAERGRVATVRRDSRTTAFVDQERLRHFLAVVCPSRAQVIAEEGGWSVFIPGLPVAADGATFDEALDEMVLALREYAEDWQDHLLDAPNHAGNWGLVQLVSLSDDDQLREWLGGARR